MFAVKKYYKRGIKVEDEATKNHGETDQDILTENKDDKYCPVHSFKLYIDNYSLQFLS